MTGLILLITIYYHYFDPETNVLSNEDPMLDSLSEFNREVKPCPDTVEVVNLLSKMSRFSDRYWPG
jgi:hypothetical protein